MSIFLNKNKTGKVFLQEKTISQVYYQQKKVFPENVVEDIDYFWFESASGSNITFSIGHFDILSDIGLQAEYSTDKITWTKYTGKKILSKEKVYLRGISNKAWSTQDTSGFILFSGATDISIGGDILTLLDKDVTSFEGKRLPDYCFQNLFYSNTGIVDASQLKLTPKLSSIGLYMSMFRECTGLVTSPQKIYLTDMSTDCCRTMFYKCSSLVNIPDTWCSNVTELGYYVYTSSISKTWKLAENCFMSCFRNTAITKLPQLPATKLANLCYAYMFAGCKGLTTQNGWYLPCESFNTNQTNGCYNYMFMDCTNLIKMATRQSNISSDYNFNWLKNITTNGTLFMKKGSTQTGFPTYVKPASWTVSKVL